MVTYGSYVPKGQNIVNAGVWIAFTDTLVALLGGLLVFPAVFAFGKDPAGGVALVFQVLPEVFALMPMGNIIGALFFLLLMVAALTSSISMLEVPVSYLIDEKRWSRKKAAWIIGAFAFLVGVPSALSNGGSETFTKLMKTTPTYTLEQNSHIEINQSDFYVKYLDEGKPKIDTIQKSSMESIIVDSGQYESGTEIGKKIKYLSFFDLMDKIWGTWGVVIVCLMFSIFSGWIIQTTRLADELALGSEGFKKPLIGNTSFADIWMFFIKYVCPVVIGIMIVFQVTE
ncbi:MAG: sodium-dependent transporter, partial [Bacteroidia bacterium]|nr:sodium-dependent transporter [Bacteroidia bacterium]